MDHTNLVQPKIFLNGVLLLLLVLPASMLARAQQITAAKSPTLDGVAEGVVVNGDLALKVSSRKSGATFIFGAKLDDERALAFQVMHWHISLLTDPGLLYVTKTRIAFIPEGSKEHQFNVLRSEVKEAKSSSKRFPLNLGHYILIDAAGGEKRFALFYSGNWGGPQGDHGKPVLEFFDIAVKDFETALNEFDRRTAAARGRAERAATEAKAKAEEEAVRAAREAAEARTRATADAREWEGTQAEIRQRETSDAEHATKRFEQALGMQSFRLSPKAASAAQNALRSLRKLAGATQIGVVRMEYSSRLIDVKSDVDEAGTSIPDGALNDELQLALRAFVDANRAWNEMIDHDFLMTAFEPGRTFQVRYTIPLDNGLARRNQVLSVIWQSAREHLDRASRLLEHTVVR
jgi:hypothetical protein